MSVRGRLLFYEGWDLANSAAFDALRWTTAVTGVTASVQSGGGRFALAGVSGAYAEFGGAGTLMPVITSPDFDLTADVTFSSVTAESYGALFAGDALANGGVALNGVGLSLIPSTSQFVIQRRDGGAQADLVAVSFTYSAATAHRIRFRRVGSWVGAKAWTPATGAEPDWLTTIIEPLYRGAAYGRITCGLFGGNVAAATTFTLDNLTAVKLSQGARRTAAR